MNLTPGGPEAPTGTPARAPSRAGLTATPASQQTIVSLEQDFPGWRVWRTTDVGTWWASRRGPRWNQEPRTLAADTPDQLRAELREIRDTTGVGQ